MKYFTISDFARITRTTRAALLHYDTLGILSPSSRDKNNYRMYSHTQLATINLIHTCQAMGMPLDEIKYLADHRTPERVTQLFDAYIKKLEGDIQALSCACNLVRTLKNTTAYALAANTEEIAIQYFHDEPIVLGERNNYDVNFNVYDALFKFYHDCCEKYPYLDLNYSAWGLFEEERIRRHDWVWPDRYFFLSPEGTDKKPAALYATGYQRGGYGKTDGLYKRILNFIDKNGFEVCGPAYEEYPLNEICVSNDQEYLIRVMITVRRISQ